jgi:hypothetical protein
VPDPRFIGLVASLRSSAEAALGETGSPLLPRLASDGALRQRTAERALGLLDMLAEKTLGHLDETERGALHDARTTLHARMQRAPAPDAAASDDGGEEAAATSPRGELR